MKKTTKKDGPRRVDFLIYSFCMVLSLMLFFCTREDNIGFLGHNKNKINLSGKGVLPVRLSMFDHNFQTKSFEQISDSSSFSLDSLITFDGFRQVFYDKSGWTYEEFPFKSNTGGLYGALLQDLNNIEDSLVNVKCYFMRVYRLGDSPILSEYVVTMIPTKTYSIENPNYDYITKPSFSGVILYSDRMGNFIKSEYLLSGLIKGCTLAVRDSIFSKSASAYGTIKTKSAEVNKCPDCDQELDSDGICWNCLGFNLSEIIITGIADDYLRNFIWLKIHGLNLSEMDYQTGNYDGGGIPDDPGYGGGYVENGDTYYLLTVLAGGCQQGQIWHENLAEGSSSPAIDITRKYSDSCWFKELNLMGNSASNIVFENNQLIVSNIHNSTTITAVYAYDNACRKLAELLGVQNFPKALRTLLLKQDIQYYWTDSLKHEWATVWYDDTTSFRLYEGERHRIKIDYQGRNLKFKIHLHPGESIIPSGSDFGTMCSDFTRHASNPMSFIYGITTSSDFISLRIGDSSKFFSFIRSKFVEQLPNEADTTYHKRQKQEYSKYYLALYAKHKLGSLTNNVQSANKLKIICAEIGLDFLFGEGYVSGNDSVSVNLVNPDFINRTMYECE